MEKYFKENDNGERLIEDDIHDMSSDGEEEPSILDKSDPEVEEEEEDFTIFQTPSDLMTNRQDLLARRRIALHQLRICLMKSTKSLKEFKSPI